MERNELAERVRVITVRVDDVRDSAAQMQPHDAEEMRDLLFDLADCVSCLAAALRANQETKA